jgi:hypothetical protein
MSPDLLRAVESWIRSVARSEIAAASGLAEQFTSRGPLPPGVSSRTFRDVCRSGAVVGAVKDGKVWTCDRASWFAARGRRPTPAPLRIVESAPTDEERADAMIKAAGFRLTKAAR